MLIKRKYKYAFLLMALLMVSVIGNAFGLSYWQDNRTRQRAAQEEKDDLQNTQKAVNDEKQKRDNIIADYAKDNNIVHQLIDLALLQNGMLKGAALDAFLKRSVSMIK